jgi:DNA-directed RNA polymerase subunit K/omega
MEKTTKYEMARIIGARALQVAMGAPLLLEVKESDSPIEIAKREFESGKLPIHVKRTMPPRSVE